MYIPSGHVISLGLYISGDKNAVEWWSQLSSQALSLSVELLCSYHPYLLGYEIRCTMNLTQSTNGKDNILTWALGGRRGNGLGAAGGIRLYLHTWMWVMCVPHREQKVFSWRKSWSKSYSDMFSLCFKHPLSSESLSISRYWPLTLQ